MNIDKIGGIGPVYGPKKTNKLNSIESISPKQDTIEISEEARIQHLMNLVKEVSKTPEEDRLEKIKDIKEKLKNGYYDNISEEILNKVADTLYDTSIETLKNIFKNPSK